MGLENIDQQNGTSSLLISISSHPYILFAIVLLFSCIVTRITTGLSVQYGNLDAPQGQPRSVPIRPYWMPFLGHTIPFGIWFQNYLKRTARQTPSGIYALKIGGATHNIVTAPSLGKELFHKNTLPITVDPIIWRFLKMAFGDNGYHEDWDKNNSVAMTTIMDVVHLMMKDPVLSDATDRIIEVAESRTWNLVSGNPSWVDHAQWERVSHVEIKPDLSKGSDFVAEADLFKLIRDFVGNIASEVIMGRAFLENNPTIFDDLWVFDSKILAFMMGMPRWLIPSLNPAIAARERLIKAVTEHHRAMIDVLEGKDPGYRYDDLHDVSKLIWARLKSFHTANSPPRIYGIGDLSIFWALNINANLTVFWLILYVYKDPTLLAAIRAELTPYIHLTHPQSTLPIAEAPQLKINIDSIMKKCPYLKGAFIETMRLEVAANSFRLVTHDFLLTESREDAIKVGKARPDTYLIKKDELVCIPLQVAHTHPTWYPNPDVFDAKRHWVKTKDDEGKEHVSVEYGNTRPWGGGKTLCKGRAIAEKEVMGLAAAIIFLWEFEPVGNKGWKHPGDLHSVSTCNPKQDIRVRMWRRKV